MPRSEERKREYNKLRQRRLRGYGGGEFERGVVPNVVPQIENHRMLSPLEKGNVVPEQMFYGGMEKVEYEAWDNETGESRGKKQAWITRRVLGRPLSREQLVGYTEMLAESGLKITGSPHYQFAPLEAMRVMQERIMQLEAALARLEAQLEAMLNPVLHEESK